MDISTWECIRCDASVETPLGRQYKPTYCSTCGGFSSYEAPASPKATLVRPGRLTAGYVPDDRLIRLGSLKNRSREPMRGLSTETNRLLGWIPDLRKHQIKATIVGSYGTRKSTTALLIGADIARAGLPVLYWSGEMGAESSMLGKVAARYSIPDHIPIDVVSIFDLVKLLKLVRKHGYKFVIFDSYNVMPQADARDFSRFSREGECSIVLICQETKAGLPAGSNKIQHDADIVLQFYREGDVRADGNRWAYKVIKHRFDSAGRIDENPFFLKEEREIAELEDSL